MVRSMTAQNQAAECRFHVLVAERDPFTRALLRPVLEASFHVTWVEDGAAVIPAVRTHQPHVIVMELLLPHVDGFQLIQQLKTDPETRHIPILVYTVLNVPERVRRLGAEGFLLKPQRPFTVCQRIRSLLSAQED